MDPSRTSKQVHMTKTHPVDVGNQADRLGDDHGPIPAPDRIPAPQTEAKIEGVGPEAAAEIAAAVARILEIAPGIFAGAGDHVLALGPDLEIGGADRRTATTTTAGAAQGNAGGTAAAAVAGNFQMKNMGIGHVAGVVAPQNVVVWPLLKIHLQSSVQPMP